MMNEKWRNISGFLGNYQVSDRGRVRSVTTVINGRLHHGTILAIRTRTDGYQDVMLYRDKKGYRPKVHTLVAREFVDNPLNFKEVNHKDEDKGNNTYSNLEWCNRKYNNAYRGLKGRRAVNKRIEVRAISDTGILKFKSVRAAAKFLNISPSGIYDCLNLRTKSSHGIRFERAN